jgi:hypothetical protein
MRKPLSACHLLTTPSKIFHRTIDYIAGGIGHSFLTLVFTYPSSSADRYPYPGLDRLLLRGWVWQFYDIGKEEPWGCPPLGKCYPIQCQGLARVGWTWLSFWVRLLFWEFINRESLWGYPSFTLMLKIRSALMHDRDDCLLLRLLHFAFACLRTGLS